MAEAFESLKGQLLLDSGQLRGSFFHRAVILICHHDAEGAFGLVLTSPTENKVGDVLVADLPDTIKDDTLFMGGPVQATALTYLHSDTFIPDASVIPNLNLGHSLDDLIEISEGFSTTRQLRCFAGYAGWSAGQLEGEMKRKAWLTHKATLENVFTSDPSNLWKKILNEKGWEYRLLADAPEDLSWN
jgi:putative transcriptional regulator